MIISFNLLYMYKFTDDKIRKPASTSQERQMKPYKHKGTTGTNHNCNNNRRPPATTDQRCQKGQTNSTQGDQSTVDVQNSTKENQLTHKHTSQLKIRHNSC